MLTYIISYQKPQQHFIDFKIIINVENDEELELQLPAWRPGRYELANFAKNIQRFKITDETGKPLKFHKTTKDSWLVNTLSSKEIIVDYNFYADVINAGSTYLDETQLYINPVNCFIYAPKYSNVEHEVLLEIPKDYKIATGMPKLAEHTLIAKDIQQLMDCPFIASNSLQHKTYEVDAITFHIWFQGECKPKWDMIIEDFKKFTKVQLDAFQDFPASQYHFINHILPYKAYHGVEHENSTVISLGPSYSVFEKKGLYNEFLGVSSHELYHTWNVKKIRDEKMIPYDFTKENYSELGYIAEGITTYYGDQMLLRSGAFNNQEFEYCFNQFLTKHFDNFGRFNMSVAQSSVDTWLDGYVQGIPNRKVSIYNEGALIAFIIDVTIIKLTEGKCSLDNVMQQLFEQYGKKRIGINKEIYQATIKQICGNDLQDIFDDLYYGTNDFTPYLKDCFEFLGWNYKEKNTPYITQNNLGIKVLNNKITSVFPNSIADEIGLWKNDTIKIINGISVNNNIDDWLNYFKNDRINLEITRSVKNHQISFELDTNRYYFKEHSIKLPINNKNHNLWLRK